MARNNLLLTAACALTLTACGPIVDIGGASGPPARIFAADGAANTSGLSLDRPTVILVEEPFTSGILDSDRMAVALSGGEIQFLPGARWADRPVRMTRRALQDALAHVEGLTPLGRGALDIPSDYRLKIQIRDFHVDAAGGPADALVGLQVWLIGPSGTLMATQTFTSRQDIALAEPAQTAQGIRTGLADTSGQITRWLAAQLSAAS